MSAIKSAAAFSVMLFLFVGIFSFVRADLNSADTLCLADKVYTLACGEPEIKDGVKTGKVGGKGCSCIDQEKTGNVKGHCTGPLTCKGDTATSDTGKDVPLKTPEKPSSSETPQQTPPSSGGTPPSGTPPASGQPDTSQPKGTTPNSPNNAWNPPVTPQSDASKAANSFQEELQRLMNPNGVDTSGSSADGQSPSGMTNVPGGVANLESPAGPLVTNPIDANGQPIQNQFEPQTASNNTGFGPQQPSVPATQPTSFFGTLSQGFQAVGNAIGGLFGSTPANATPASETPNDSSTGGDQSGSSQTTTPTPDTRTPEEVTLDELRALQKDQRDIIDNPNSTQKQISDAQQRVTVLEGRINTVNQMIESNQPNGAGTSPVSVNPPTSNTPPVDQGPLQPGQPLPFADQMKQFTDQTGTGKNYTASQIEALQASVAQGKTELGKGLTLYNTDSATLSSAVEQFDADKADLKARMELHNADIDTCNAGGCTPDQIAQLNANSKALNAENAALAERAAAITQQSKDLAVRAASLNAAASDLQNQATAIQNLTNQNAANISQAQKDMVAISRAVGDQYGVRAQFLPTSFSLADPSKPLTSPVTYDPNSRQLFTVYGTQEQADNAERGYLAAQTLLARNEALIANREQSIADMQDPNKATYYVPPQGGADPLAHLVEQNEQIKAATAAFLSGDPALTEKLNAVGLNEAQLAQGGTVLSTIHSLGQNSTDWSGIGQSLARGDITGALGGLGEGLVYSIAGHIDGAIGNNTSTEYLGVFSPSAANDLRNLDRLAFANDIGLVGSALQAPVRALAGVADRALGTGIIESSASFAAREVATVTGSRVATEGALTSGAQSAQAASDAAALSQARSLAAPVADTAPLSAARAVEAPSATDVAANSAAQNLKQGATNVEGGLTEVEKAIANLKNETGAGTGAASNPTITSQQAQTLVKEIEKQTGGWVDGAALEIKGASGQVEGGLAKVEDALGAFKSPGTGAATEVTPLRTIADEAAGNPALGATQSNAARQAEGVFDAQLRSDLENAGVKVGFNEKGEPVFSNAQTGAPMSQAQAIDRMGTVAEQNRFSAALDDIRAGANPTAGTANPSTGSLTETQIAQRDITAQLESRGVSVKYDTEGNPQFFKDGQQISSRDAVLELQQPSNTASLRDRLNSLNALEPGIDTIAVQRPGNNWAQTPGAGVDTIAPRAVSAADTQGQAAIARADAALQDVLKLTRTETGATAGQTQTLAEIRAAAEANPGIGNVAPTNGTANSLGNVARDAAPESNVAAFNPRAQWDPLAADGGATAGQNRGLGGLSADDRILPNVGNVGAEAGGSSLGRVAAGVAAGGFAGTIAYQMTGGWVDSSGAGVDVANPSTEPSVQFASTNNPAEGNVEVNPMVSTAQTIQSALAQANVGVTTAEVTDQLNKLGYNVTHDADGNPTFTQDGAPRTFDEVVKDIKTVQGENLPPVTGGPAQPQVEKTPLPIDVPQIGNAKNFSQLYNGNVPSVEMRAALYDSLREMGLITSQEPYTGRGNQNPEMFEALKTYQQPYYGTTPATYNPDNSPTGGTRFAENDVTPTKTDTTPGAEPAKPENNTEIPIENEPGTNTETPPLKEPAKQLLPFTSDGTPANLGLTPEQQKTIELFGKNTAAKPLGDSSWLASVMDQPQVVQYEIDKIESAKQNLQSFNQDVQDAQAASEQYLQSCISSGQCKVTYNSDGKLQSITPATDAVRTQFLTLDQNLKDAVKAQIAAATPIDNLAAQVNQSTNAYTRPFADASPEARDAARQYDYAQKLLDAAQVRMNDPRTNADVDAFFVAQDTRNKALGQLFDLPLSRPIDPTTGLPVNPAAAERVDNAQIMNNLAETRLAMNTADSEAKIAEANRMIPYYQDLQRGLYNNPLTEDQEREILNGIKQELKDTIANNDPGSPEAQQAQKLLDQMAMSRNSVPIRALDEYYSSQILNQKDAIAQSSNNIKSNEYILNAIYNNSEVGDVYAKTVVNPSTSPAESRGILAQAVEWSKAQYDLEHSVIQRDQYVPDTIADLKQRIADATNPRVANAAQNQINILEQRTLPQVDASILDAQQRMALSDKAVTQFQYAETREPGSEADKFVKAVEGRDTAGQIRSGNAGQYILDSDSVLGKVGATLDVGITGLGMGSRAIGDFFTGASHDAGFTNFLEETCGKTCAGLVNPFNMVALPFDALSRQLAPTADEILMDMNRTTLGRIAANGSDYIAIGSLVLLHPAISGPVDVAGIGLRGTDPAISAGAQAIDRAAIIDAYTKGGGTIITDRLPTLDASRPAGPIDVNVSPTPAGGLATEVKVGETPILRTPEQAPVVAREPAPELFPEGAAYLKQVEAVKNDPAAVQALKDSTSPEIVENAERFQAYKDAQAAGAAPVEPSKVPATTVEVPTLTKAQEDFAAKWNDLEAKKAASPDAEKPAVNDEINALFAEPDAASHASAILKRELALRGIDADVVPGSLEPVKPATVVQTIDERAAAYQAQVDRFNQDITDFRSQGAPADLVEKIAEQRDAFTRNAPEDVVNRAAEIDKARGLADGSEVPARAGAGADVATQPAVGPLQRNVVSLRDIANWAKSNEEVAGSIAGQTERSLTPAPADAGTVAPKDNSLKAGDTGNTAAGSGQSAFDKIRENNANAFTRIANDNATDLERVDPQLGRQRPQYNDLIQRAADLESTGDPVGAAALRNEAATVRSEIADRVQELNPGMGRTEALARADAQIANPPVDAANLSTNSFARTGALDRPVADIVGNANGEWARVPAETDATTAGQRSTLADRGTTPADASLTNSQPTLLDLLRKVNDDIAASDAANRALAAREAGPTDAGANPSTGSGLQRATTDELKQAGISNVDGVFKGPEGKVLSPEEVEAIAATNRVTRDLTTMRDTAATLENVDGANPSTRSLQDQQMLGAVARELSDLINREPSLAPTPSVADAAANPSTKSLVDAVQLKADFDAIAQGNKEGFARVDAERNGTANSSTNGLVRADEGVADIADRANGGWVRGVEDTDSTAGQKSLVDQTRTDTVNAGDVAGTGERPLTGATEPNSGSTAGQSSTLTDRGTTPADGSLTNSQPTLLDLLRKVNDDIAAADRANVDAANPSTRSAFSEPTAAELERAGMIRNADGTYTDAATGKPVTPGAVDLAVTVNRVVDDAAALIDAGRSPSTRSISDNAAITDAGTKLSDAINREKSTLARADTSAGDLSTVPQSLRRILEGARDPAAELKSVAQGVVEADASVATNRGLARVSEGAGPSVIDIATRGNGDWARVPNEVDASTAGTNASLAAQQSDAVLARQLTQELSDRGITVAGYDEKGTPLFSRDGQPISSQAAVEALQRDAAQPNTNAALGRGITSDDVAAKIDSIKAGNAQAVADLNAQLAANPISRLVAQRDAALDASVAQSRAWNPLAENGALEGQRGSIAGRTGEPVDSTVPAQNTTANLSKLADQIQKDLDVAGGANPQTSASTKITLADLRDAGITPVADVDAAGKVTISGFKDATGRPLTDADVNGAVAISRELKLETNARAGEGEGSAGASAAKNTDTSAAQTIEVTPEQKIKVDQVIAKEEEITAKWKEEYAKTGQTPTEAEIQRAQSGVFDDLPGVTQAVQDRLNAQVQRFDDLRVAGSDVADLVQAQKEGSTLVAKTESPAGGAEVRSNTEPQGGSVPSREAQALDRWEKALSDAQDAQKLAESDPKNVDNAIKANDATVAANTAEQEYLAAVRAREAAGDVAPGGSTQPAAREPVKITDTEREAIAAADEKLREAAAKTPTPPKGTDVEAQTVAEKDAQVKALKDYYQAERKAVLAEIQGDLGKQGLRLKQDFAGQSVGLVDGIERIPKNGETPVTVARNDAGRLVPADTPVPSPRGNVNALVDQAKADVARGTGAGPNQGIVRPQATIADVAKATYDAAKTNAAAVWDATTYAIQHPIETIRGVGQSIVDAAKAAWNNPLDATLAGVEMLRAVTFADPASIPRGAIDAAMRPAGITETIARPVDTSLPAGTRITTSEPAAPAPTTPATAVKPVSSAPAPVVKAIEEVRAAGALAIKEGTPFPDSIIQKMNDLRSGLTPESFAAVSKANADYTKAVNDLNTATARGGVDPVTLMPFQGAVEATRMNLARAAQGITLDETLAWTTAPSGNLTAAPSGVTPSQPTTPVTVNTPAKPPVNGGNATQTVPPAPTTNTTNIPRVNTPQTTAPAPVANTPANTTPTVPVVVAPVKANTLVDVIRPRAMAAMSVDKPMANSDIDYVRSLVDNKVLTPLAQGVISKSLNAFDEASKNLTAILADKTAHTQGEINFANTRESGARRVLLVDVATTLAVDPNKADLGIQPKPLASNPPIAGSNSVSRPTASAANTPASGAPANTTVIRPATPPAVTPLPMTAGALADAVRVRANAAVQAGQALSPADFDSVSKLLSAGVLDGPSAKEVAQGLVDILDANEKRITMPIATAQRNLAIAAQNMKVDPAKASRVVPGVTLTTPSSPAPVTKPAAPTPQPRFTVISALVDAIFGFGSAQAQPFAGKDAAHNLLALNTKDQDSLLNTASARPSGQNVATQALTPDAARAKFDSDKANWIAANKSLPDLKKQLDELVKNKQLTLRSGVYTPTKDAVVENVQPVIDAYKAARATVNSPVEVPNLAPQATAKITGTPINILPTGYGPGGGGVQGGLKGAVANADGGVLLNTAQDVMKWRLSGGKQGKPYGAVAVTQNSGRLRDFYYVKSFEFTNVDDGVRYVIPDYIAQAYDHFDGGMTYTPKTDFALGNYAGTSDAMNYIINHQPKINGVSAKSGAKGDPEVQILKIDSATAMAQLGNYDPARHIAQAPLPTSYTAVASRSNPAPSANTIDAEQPDISLASAGSKSATPPTRSAEGVSTIPAPTTAALRTTNFASAPRPGGKVIVDTSNYDKLKGPATIVTFFGGNTDALKWEDQVKKVSNQVKSSGVNAILVSPDFGSVVAARDNVGSFGKPKGFTNFLTELGQYLSAETGQPTDVFDAMPVALAYFSGGYGPATAAKFDNSGPNSRIRADISLEAGYGVDAVTGYAPDSKGALSDNVNYWLKNNKDAVVVSAYAPSNARGGSTAGVNTGALPNLLKENNIAFSTNALKPGETIPPGSVRIVEIPGSTHLGFLDKAPLGQILASIIPKGESLAWAPSEGGGLLPSNPVVASNQPKAANGVAVPKDATPAKVVLDLTNRSKITVGDLRQLYSLTKDEGIGRVLTMIDKIPSTDKSNFMVDTRFFNPQTLAQFIGAVNDFAKVYPDSKDWLAITGLDAEGADVDRSGYTSPHTGGKAIDMQATEETPQVKAMRAALRAHGFSDLPLEHGGASTGAHLHTAQANVRTADLANLKLPPVPASTKLASDATPTRTAAATRGTQQAAPAAQTLTPEVIAQVKDALTNPIEYRKIGDVVRVPGISRDGLSLQVVAEVENKNRNATAIEKAAWLKSLGYTDTYTYRNLLRHAGNNIAAVNARVAQLPTVENKATPYVVPSSPLELAKQNNFTRWLIAQKTDSSDPEFGWKLADAVQRGIKSNPNTNIRTMKEFFNQMNPDFEVLLDNAGNLALQDGVVVTLTAGYRDRSWAGSASSGFHPMGLAVDARGLGGTDNTLWKWLDSHMAQTGIWRPYVIKYTGYNDPPHVGPVNTSEHGGYTDKVRNLPQILASAQANANTRIAELKAQTPEIGLASAGTRIVNPSAIEGVETVAPESTASETVVKDQTTYRAAAAPVTVVSPTLLPVPLPTPRPFSLESEVPTTETKTAETTPPAESTAPATAQTQAPKTVEKAEIIPLPRPRPKTAAFQTPTLSVQIDDMLRAIQQAAPMTEIVTNQKSPTQAATQADATAQTQKNAAADTETTPARAPRSTIVDAIFNPIADFVLYLFEKLFPETARSANPDTNVSPQSSQSGVLRTMETAINNFFDIVGTNGAQAAPAAKKPAAKQPAAPPQRQVDQKKLDGLSLEQLDSQIKDLQLKIAKQLNLSDPEKAFGALPKYKADLTDFKTKLQLAKNSLAGPINNVITPSKKSEALYNGGKQNEATVEGNKVRPALNILVKDVKDLRSVTLSPEDRANLVKAAESADASAKTLEGTIANAASIYFSKKPDGTSRFADQKSFENYIKGLAGSFRSTVAAIPNTIDEKIKTQDAAIADADFLIRQAQALVDTRAKVAAGESVEKIPEVPEQVPPPATVTEENTPDNTPRLKPVPEVPIVSTDVNEPVDATPVSSASLWDRVTNGVNNVVAFGRFAVDMIRGNNVVVEDTNPQTAENEVTAPDTSPTPTTQEPASDITLTSAGNPANAPAPSPTPVPAQVGIVPRPPEEEIVQTQTQPRAPAGGAPVPPPTPTNAANPAAPAQAAGNAANAQAGTSGNIPRAVWSGTKSVTKFICGSLIRGTMCGILGIGGYAYITTPGGSSPNRPTTPAANVPSSPPTPATASSNPPAKPVVEVNRTNKGDREKIIPGTTPNLNVPPTADPGKPLNNAPKPPAQQNGNSNGSNNGSNVVPKTTPGGSRQNNPPASSYPPGAYPSATGFGGSGGSGSASGGLFYMLGQMIGKLFGGGQSSTQPSTPQQNTPAPTPSTPTTSVSTPTATLVSNPPIVNSGATAQLAWSSTDAVECSILSSEGVVLKDGKGAGTVTTGVLTASTLFNLNCTNASGIHATSSVRVTVQ